MSDTNPSNVTLVDAADTDQLPPPPVVPPNVTETGLPSTSDSVYADGSALDFIPIAQYCMASSCSGKITSIGDDIIGIMAPDGSVHQPKWSYDGNYGDLLYVLMLNPASETAQGTIIKQQSYWQRLSQSYVPAGTPHTTQVTITSGVSQTEAEQLSVSVGANLGFSDTITGGLSADLSKSFSQSITISEETSVSEEFSFQAQPSEQVTGVYQLVQVYNVYPGDNLVKAMAGYKSTQDLICSGQLPGSCQNAEVVMPFTYPTASYLQIFGVDSSDAVYKATMTRESLLRAITPTIER